jgi:ABC-type nitrate/sulfonate/bicarbonate transport system permease component
MTTNVQTVNGIENRMETYPMVRILDPRVYIRLTSLVLVIGLWELMGLLGYISPATFSYPSAIIIAFLELLLNGKMIAAAYESSKILFAGLGIAIPVGIFIGIMMGRFKTFEYAVDTYVFALFATPVVARALPRAV